MHFIILYLIFIILGSVGSTKNVRAIDLNIFSFLFLGIAIFLFEIAYRKEKMSTCFWAIELLALGLIIMFVPYLSNYAQYIILGISVGFGIYYFAKFIAIVIKKHKDFSDEKSDVKDIVKDEKKGYLDEVSKKKFKKDGEKKND